MHELYNREFGFVLFDDVDAPRGGWVSASGRPAERVSDVQELRNDVIWVTNLKFADFSNADFNKLPWLRQAAFLGVLPDVLLGEWGYDKKVISQDVYVRTVSACVSRIARIAYQLVKKIDPRVPMSKVFLGNTLAADLGAFLTPGTFEFGDEIEVMKRDTSHQAFTSLRSVGKNLAQAQFRMRLPRIALTTELFQTPVPTGDFQFMTERELNKRFGASPAKAMAQHDGPVLAEVVVKTSLGDAGDVFSFGGGQITNNKIVRSWAPHPEFLILNEVAEIEVKSAYIGTGYKVPMAELPEAVQDFLGDPNNEYSWSAGIVAEALRRAYASKVDEEYKKQLRAKSRSDVSWESLWLKSAERVLTYLSAMSLKRAGHVISSYNSGVVRCRVTNGAETDVIMDAVASGLLPDVATIPEGLKANSAMQWGGDKLSLNTARLHITRDIATMWALDEMPLLSQKDRVAVIQKIKSRAMARA